TTSCTGRSSKPPASLMACAANLMLSTALLPSAAAKPLRGARTPTLIGFASCANTWVAHASSTTSNSFLSMSNLLFGVPPCPASWPLSRWPGHSSEHGQYKTGCLGCHDILALSSDATATAVVPCQG